MINKSQIDKLSIGQSILQIENTVIGSFKHKGRITNITNAFIEVEYIRHPYPEIIEATTKLQPYHRTFEKTWQKNYFDNDGNTNLELC